MKTVPKCFRCWHKTAVFLKLLPSLFKIVTDHKWRANSLASCSNSCVAALRIVSRLVDRQHWVMSCPHALLTRNKSRMPGMGRDFIEQLTCLVFLGHLPRDALFIINTTPWIVWWPVMVTRPIVSPPIQHIRGKIHSLRNDARSFRSSVVHC